MHVRSLVAMVALALFVASVLGATGWRAPAAAQQPSYSVVIQRAGGTTDTYTYPFQPSIMTITSDTLYLSGTHNGIVIDFIPIPFAPGDRIVRIDDGTPPPDPNLPRAVPYTGPPIILTATATPTREPGVVMGPHGPEKARETVAPAAAAAAVVAAPGVPSGTSAATPDAVVSPGAATAGAPAQQAAAGVVPQPARTGHGVGR